MILNSFFFLIMHELETKIAVFLDGLIIFY